LVTMGGKPPTVTAISKKKGKGGGEETLLSLIKKKEPGRRTVDRGTKEGGTKRAAVSIKGEEKKKRDGPLYTVAYGKYQKESSMPCTRGNVRAKKEQAISHVFAEGKGKKKEERKKSLCLRP